MKENLYCTLSVVIPFLNEGIEVENTINSILEFKSEYIREIIIINDASDDGYNYDSLSARYPIKYVKNPKRLGVAASRNLGVDIASGKYILLLDAHMRFYDSLWAKTIVETLSDSSLVVLCCQSKGLRIINGELCEIVTDKTPYGASVNFTDSYRFLECEWLLTDYAVSQSYCEIPCIFGAAYACSKETWAYIGGLEGLIQYGNDEAYISIKTWLFGGKCKLLKNTIVGHIYRSEFPYNVDVASRIFNRLWIADLLLEKDNRSRVFAYSRNLSNYQQALREFFCRRECFYKLYNYYKSISVRGIGDFMAFNDERRGTRLRFKNVGEVLRDTEQFVNQYYEDLKSISLENGKLGALLFLFQYSNYINDRQLNDKAIAMLESLLIDYMGKPEDFLDVVQIGWCMVYLMISGIIPMDKLFHHVEVIFERMAYRISANVFDGLRMMIRFLLGYIYITRNCRSMLCFFDCGVLYEYVLGQCEKGELCQEYLSYIFYYENKIVFPPSVYDVMTVYIPNGDYVPCRYNLGLSGASGVGIKLIIDGYE